MAGNKEFNTDIDLKGKLKMTSPPNNTGKPLVYDPASGYLSFRESSEFIADLDLITTTTGDNRYVNKTGDTMTGSLNIQYPTASNQWVHKMNSGGLSNYSGFWSSGTGNFHLYLRNASGNANIILKPDGESDFVFGIKADYFKKSGGTSTQFLKADGSVDSSTYLTTESDTLQSVTDRNNVTTNSIYAQSLSTNYAVSFTNGNTKFLLYNNTGNNLLYMRDSTNGQMLTTWYTTKFQVNKDLQVDGIANFNGTYLNVGGGAGSTGTSIDNLGNIQTDGGFIKTGGTSAQFLKADGSVDSSTYLTAESDTLQSVTDRGSVTTNRLGVNNGIYHYHELGARDIISVSNPKGGAKYLGDITQTGAIKITLPYFFTATMMKMTVEVYDYSTNESFTLKVGGYNYNANNTWVNCYAQIIGSKDRDFKIRFGNDGVNTCIWIGEVTDTWTYGQVVVTDFIGSFSGVQSGWAEGWNISLETVFDTVQTTLSNNLPYGDYDKLKNVPAYGSTANTITQGNDSRLNNNRFPSNDSDLVHKSGTETITGKKTFNAGINDVPTEIGYTSQSYRNFTALSEWQLPVGGSRFVQSTSISSPGSAGYWNVTGRRDAAGGYSGIYTPFGGVGNNSNAYIGYTIDGTVAPTWDKIWTDRSLTNVSQLNNDAGYITEAQDNQTLSFTNGDLSISAGNTVDLDSRFVKKSGDTMTGNLNGSYNILESFELSSTGEHNMVWNPAMYNDLGYLFDRGGSITTVSSPTNFQLTSNIMFDGSSSHQTIYATDMPIVFEINFPTTFTYGLRLGIAFGSVSFRPKDVKIEAFSEGVWTTIFDETNSDKVKISANVPGNSNIGTTKARFTLANPVSTYIRVVHIWAGRYNSGLAKTMFVGRDGGDLYGDLNSTGGASFDKLVSVSSPSYREHLRIDRSGNGMYITQSGTSSLIEVFGGTTNLNIFGGAFLINGSGNNVSSGSNTATAFINSTSDNNSILLGGGGTKLLSDFQAAGDYVENITPNAPTGATATVVGDNIEVSFNESSTTNVDEYLVYSAVGTGEFGLISVIPPEDFTATMTIVDGSFEESSTINYKVYAAKNGRFSVAATTSVVFSSINLEPTNLKVIPTNTTFVIEWDRHESRFVDRYEVYKHTHSDVNSLARVSAALVYSGDSTTHTHSILVSEENDYHQFWVEIITK